jgi:hypothetical protein
VPPDCFRLRCFVRFEPGRRTLSAATVGLVAASHGCQRLAFSEMANGASGAPARRTASR